MPHTALVSSEMHPCEDVESGGWDKRKIGRVFPAKTPIFHQGDDAEHFFRVNSGVVMIYRLLENSQRQITGFCTAGDFFGLSPDATYHDTAMTVTTANIVSVSMQDVEDNPELRQEIFTSTCGLLEDAQNMMMTLSKKTAGEKVAAFLLMLANRQAAHSANAELRKTEVKLPMSRLDIADYLGLTIETVSRRLTDLKTSGIIDLPTRHTANIREWRELETLAGALF